MCLIIFWFQPTRIVLEMGRKTIFVVIVRLMHSSVVVIYWLNELCLFTCRNGRPTRVLHRGLMSTPSVIHFQLRFYVANVNELVALIVMTAAAVTGEFVTTPAQWTRTVTGEFVATPAQWTHTVTGEFVTTPAQ